jgi:hypothetical protein
VASAVFAAGLGASELARVQQTSANGSAAIRSNTKIGKERDEAELRPRVQEGVQREGSKAAI